LSGKRKLEPEIEVEEQMNPAVGALHPASFGPSSAVSIDEISRNHRVKNSQRETGESMRIVIK